MLHPAVAPPPFKIQLPKLKEPVPLLVKLTKPVGVITAPVVVSVTVTVQVLACQLTTTDVGVQEMLVVVDLRLAVRLPLP